MKITMFETESWQKKSNSEMSFCFGEIKEIMFIQMHEQEIIQKYYISNLQLKFMIHKPKALVAWLSSLWNYHKSNFTYSKLIPHLYFRFSQQIVLRLSLWTSQNLSCILVSSILPMLSHKHESTSWLYFSFSRLVNVQQSLMTRRDYSQEFLNTVAFDFFFWWVFLFAQNLPCLPFSQQNLYP